MYTQKRAQIISGLGDFRNGILSGNHNPEQEQNIISTQETPHASSDRLTSPGVSVILMSSSRDCLACPWTWHGGSLQYVHFCAWLFPHYVCEIRVWYCSQQFMLSCGCILFHCMNWLIGLLTAESINNSAAENILVCIFCWMYYHLSWELLANKGVSTCNFPRCCQTDSKWLQ